MCASFYIIKFMNCNSQIYYTQCLKDVSAIKIIYVVKFIKYLQKYWSLGYDFLVKIDLHKMSVLLVYNILTFEKTDIWLNWDDNIMKVQPFSNNLKNIDF